MNGRSSQMALVGSRIATRSGVIEGRWDPESDLRAFLGVPFAEPPVGDLRFAPPQPPKSWSGVRKAENFGPRPMQLPVFGDMNFRSDGMSEDCLYLNIWTPARSADDRLAVLVYFYGGGNVAGDGSEPRYDGAALARRGIVTVTANYRLNVFGFFSHPELSEESRHGVSGNQAYLDQRAALRWVRDNIAAFGGDPGRVSVAGESAGSFSVSIQMASPLSRDLIAGAIGSSGAAIGGPFAPGPLAEHERRGFEFAAELGADSLAALRTLPPEALLEATSVPQISAYRPVVDGYFLPRSVSEIFAAGDQAKVPLLVGWNSEEGNYRSILGQTEPTPQAYEQSVRALYGELAGEVLRLYPATTPDGVIAAATDLASDRFLGYSTWKWAELHGETGQAPVFRYLYTHPRPPMVPEMGDAVAGLAGGILRKGDPKAKAAPPSHGAVHAADIEYAMGNLATNLVYAWTAQDYEVSETMQTCYANFVRTGDPNGTGMPLWPPANAGGEVHVMRWDVESQAAPERNRERYLFHDRLSGWRD